MLVVSEMRYKRGPPTVGDRVADRRRERVDGKRLLTETWNMRMVVQDCGMRPRVWLQIHLRDAQ